MAASAPQVLDAGDCPRCGTAHAQYQEYCLGCGLRLPAEPGIGEALAAAAGRRTAWSPGAWVWTVAALLVVAVVAAAAVLALRSTGNEDPLRLVVATTAVGEEIATVPVSGLPSETIESSLTLPEEDAAPERPPPGPRPRAGSPNRRVQWPVDANGFTIVLASVPRRSRDAAAAKAKEAADAGVKQVGVLDSSEFSSLHPGYLVVFTGVFETRKQAEAAIATVRESGYNDAYAAEVAR